MWEEPCISQKKGSGTVFFSGCTLRCCFCQNYQISQYTPFYHSSDFKGINRRITTYEYQKVVDTALDLGLLAGFMQKKSSAKEEYTPPFNLDEVL